MQELILKRIGPRTFELVRDFVSESSITVPSGFVSDGLSLPIYLRWIVSPTGLGFNAAVVHDYLLHEGYDWDYAAERFGAQLELDGISYTRRKMYLLGVKIWGILWKK